MRECFRITAITRVGRAKPTREPFPYNKTFKTKFDAKKEMQKIKEANKGTYNLRMLFSKPRVEKC